MATPGSSEGTPKLRGLSSEEVEARRRQYGANVLTPPKRDPWWKLYLEKFDDPVIRILIIAAIIAIGVGIVEGHFAEGVGILVAIFLATTLAFLNEYQAAREFDILNKVSDDVAVKVIRDGAYTSVPRKDLVVDDLVLVELGEECPADGQLLEAVSLEVDESRLTGESVSAAKRVIGDGDRPSHDGAAYPENVLLRGSMIADGHGTMRITAVGDSTEIGRTARAAAEATGEQTPLTRQLERLSKVIGVFAFGIAGLLFVTLVVRGVVVGELVLSPGQWMFTAVLLVSVLVGLVRVWLPIVYDMFQILGRDVQPPSWIKNGTWRSWLWTILASAGLFIAGITVGMSAGWISRSPAEWLPTYAGEELLTYFMVAVALIVVAVPEGLAMSVTLSLAYSMRKMIATNNLVRRMLACETIGAATVICCDKTGTLTMNEMRTRATHFPLIDDSARDGPAAESHDHLGFIAEAIAANSTANLHREPDKPPTPLGNPTEGALLLWLDDHQIDYLEARSKFPIDHQWTFSTERKYMATLGTSPRTGRRVLHVKGAPEVVLDRSAHVLTADGLGTLGQQRAEIEAELAEYQKRGMRTLALAYREISDDDPTDELDQLARGLAWIGFVAIHDPVRPEVPPAVEACHEAGIAVKIVTGDNRHTAKEVARQIGLWQDDDPESRLLTGAEFGSLPDAEARPRVLDMKILSRARPLDKMRLVRLLQDEDQVVAVTGDGTNDAPALNYANVGLSMGRSGTAVAKEASDIVLLDDSFRTIVNAVMWGRSLYENIQRFILYQLTSNVAALGTIFLGPFIGFKLPLTVTQMLWVNLIMDTFAALALATEPPHWSVMKRQPRRSQEFIVTKGMARGICGVAGAFLVLLVSLLLLVQRVDLCDGLTINRAATAAKAAEVTDYEITIFFTTFVLLQFWNLFNARCLGQTYSALSKLTENKGFLAIIASIFVGQVLITQHGGEIFRTVPLSLHDWVVLVLVTSLVLWGGELWRAVQRRMNPPQAALAEGLG
jgi:Ca2+-transporting ATPase